MKLRNLLPALLSAVLITLSLSAHAQKSWTPPTMPDAVEFANDQSYYIQNVGTGQFLTAANSWATQISVGTDGQPFMRFYTLWHEAGEEVSYVWRESDYVYDRYLTTFAAGYMIQVDGTFTVSSTTPVNRTNWTVGNTVLFRDNELSGFIDLNRQTYGYLWKFTPVGNGDYFIQTVEGDTQFPNAATQCMAAYNAGEAVAFNAEMTMNDEDGYYDSHLLWRFYSAEGVDCYLARMRLYDMLVEASNAGVDTSAASAVYNDSSASADELTAALEQLRIDISTQGLEAVIAGASAENPVDITDYVITNADFSQGNLNGWSVEGWTLGSSIQGNVMYQSASYSGDSGATISGFIESWCSSTYAPLSDGAFLQTLSGLPAGRYRLEADCIAVDQYNGTAATGAYLFEEATGTRQTQALATGNESPQHFELSFSLTSAGDITIGVLTENTNINWLAADNFRLTYYGNDGDELAFLASELSRELETARALQSQIPSGAWARLSAIISQYDQTYTTAAQYNTAIEAVRSTRYEMEAMVTPYANYLSVVAQTDSITDHSSDAWETLNVAITAANTTVNATSVTAEQIVEATADLRAALAAYNATQGGTNKDITAAYITNPSPYAFIDGWETPLGEPNAFDSVNRCAEFWNRQGYVLQQTLHDLPAGDYTLTAIAFTRTGYTATLFAGETSIPLVTVGSDVVNTRAQANAWFNAGNGVNSLNFTMAAAGDITIGIRAATENDGWTAWRSFTLTTGNTGQEGRTVGDQFTVTNAQGYELTFTVTSATTCALTAAPDIDGLTIPEQADGLQVKEIGEGVFSSASLTSISLPASIETIGKNAFRGSQLATFPELPNLCTIGAYAFYGCTNLTEIVLGPSVESISNYAFFGNTNITGVTVQSTTPPTAQSNIFSSGVYTKATLTVPEGTESTYRGAAPWSTFATITDGTEVKDGDTFSYTYQGTTLQYTILSVESATCSVSGGADVAEVVIPSVANDFTVVSISDRAFHRMTNLTRVTFPSTLQSIGAYAFYSCSALTEVEFPASLTSIGAYAFYANSNLTKVTVNSTTPPTAQSTTFSSIIYSKAELHLNQGGKQAYAAAEPWSRFENVVDGTAIYLKVNVEGNGTVSYVDAEGKSYSTGAGSISIPVSSASETITLQLTAAKGSYLKSVSYYIVSTTVDYTSRVGDDGKLSMTVAQKGTILTVTFAERNVYNLDVVVEGSGTVTYTNEFGETFKATTGSTQIPVYADNNIINLTVQAAEGYLLSEIIYDKVTGTENFTSKVTEDGTLRMGVYRNGTKLTVKFIQRSVQLFVQREGNGVVKLGGKELTFPAAGMATPDVSNMKSFVFNFQPDAGFRLEAVFLNNDDVTNRVDANGNLDLTADIFDGVYILRVVFLEGFPTFVSNDFTFGIPNASKKEVCVMPRKYLSTDVVIPEAVEYNGATYAVSSLSDGAFAANENLRCITLPNSLNTIGSNLFDGCTHLAAIIWNRTLPFPDEAFGTFRNPNLLFYSMYASQAPQNSGVIAVWKNDGDYRTNRKVVLQEGINYHDFYCPIPFTAEAGIEYTHEFLMKTEPHTAQGWETMVLPFNVDYFYHNEKGRGVIPYATTTEDDVLHKNLLPFWLYTYAADGEKEWVETETMQANRPYLISMPNYERYPADYQLGGRVTFRGQSGCIVPATEEVSVTRGERTFHANLKVQTSQDFYLLNAKNAYVNYTGAKNPGSVFLKQSKYSDRPAVPFECYFTTTAAGVKEIGIFDDVVNAVRELPTDLPEKPVEGVYDLSGRKMNASTRLHRGFYIVNGQKVLVR